MTDTQLRRHIGNARDDLEEVAEWWDEGASP